MSWSFDGFPGRFVGEPDVVGGCAEDVGSDGLRM